MISRTYTGLGKILMWKMSDEDSLGLYERKQHKPWLDEECLQFLCYKNQAKMQWLEDPDQSHVDITTLYDMKLVGISETKRGNI
jgi:hypothetical protein